jgi:hypothetical protein
VPEARRLVKLALSFNPELTTAQHPALELEGAKAPEVAPATSANERAGSSSKAPPRRGAPRVAEPKIAEPKAPEAKTPDKAPPPSSAGAVLPPSPAPLPPDRPPPASTGPWL